MCPGDLKQVHDPHQLIDEIIQDTSGRRSFFYVGDVKQAVYRWRGGNPKLFNEILDRYGSSIRQLPLNTSYRSCQPVITRSTISSATFRTRIFPL